MNELALYKPAVVVAALATLWTLESIAPEFIDRRRRLSHNAHNLASRYQPETDSNYSSVFSWWDRLFRSFRLREDPSTIRLGLNGYGPREWRRLDGMLLSPFRHRGATTARTPEPTRSPVCVQAGVGMTYNA